MQDDSPQISPFQPNNEIPLPLPSTTDPLSPSLSPVKKTTKWYKSTVFIVLLLIFIPPVGLVLMWALASWTKLVKTLVTVPAIISSVVFLLIFPSFFQAIINQGVVLKPEQVKMERFLEEKYGKDFIVRSGKVVSGGDPLLGVKFKTYKANVSPSDDTNMVFTASRIIQGRSLDGGADSPDKLNYSDDYLLQSWTSKLQDRVKSVVMSQPINAFSVAFHVGLTKNRASTAEFYDNIWGTAPSYDELSLELKQELTFASDIKVVGTMNAEKVEDYAKAMIAIRDSLDPKRQGLGVQINSFEVYGSQKEDEELGKWQNVGLLNLSEVESIDEITPYFVQWTDGYGKYYNPKTRVFDINHPN